MAVMNSITDNDLENVHYLERWRPKLDESFIKKIDDKDFVLYSGLLDVAHQKNLSMVDVELIQFPSDENKQTAICKAKVETVDGKKFFRYRRRQSCKLQFQGGQAFNPYGQHQGKSKSFP